jgi:hypothetical protein
MGGIAGNLDFRARDGDTIGSANDARDGLRRCRNAENQRERGKSKLGGMGKTHDGSFFERPAGKAGQPVGKYYLQFICIYQHKIQDYSNLQMIVK